MCENKVKNLIGLSRLGLCVQPNAGEKYYWAT